MKANLKEDIIIMLTVNGKTEIGPLPKDVGLERLRFDGQKVIDLFDLIDGIWVRSVNGVFELHAVEVKGSQKVAMHYIERKNLVMDGNTIRLKTTQEITNEKIKLYEKQVLSQLNRRLKGKLGDMTELTLNNTMLIMALIVYVRNQPSALSDFFDELIPHILDTFPLNKWKDTLKNACVELKDSMEEYHSNINKNI